MYKRPGAFRCICDNRLLWTWSTITHIPHPNTPRRCIQQIFVYIKIGHVFNTILEFNCGRLRTSKHKERAREGERAYSCQWRSRPHVMPSRAPITTSRMWCTCKNTRPKHAATLHGDIVWKWWALYHAYLHTYTTQARHLCYLGLISESKCDSLSSRMMNKWGAQDE